VRSPFGTYRVDRGVVFSAHSARWQRMSPTGSYVGAPNRPVRNGAARNSIFRKTAQRRGAWARFRIEFSGLALDRFFVVFALRENAEINCGNTPALVAAGNTAARGPHRRRLARASTRVPSRGAFLEAALCGKLPQKMRLVLWGFRGHGRPTPSTKNRVPFAGISTAQLQSRISMGGAGRQCLSEEVAIAIDKHLLKKA